MITKERKQPSGLLPWLNVYFSRADPEGTLLLDKICSHLQSCNNEGATYRLLCDPDYPPLLREIPQPPLGLSLLGDPFLLNTSKISVIGSRRTASPVLQECHRLGYLLAKLGLTVVSGGAFGCDIATHTGVLSSGLSPLPAVVVFASGLKHLSPQGNRPRFEDILRGGGVLLSERLWDQVPMPYDFPIRNRIISGLSMWTLVMGASRQSGAMLTAKLALDQGREVCVYLPDPDGYYCEGAQILEREGALAFISADDFCMKILNRVV
jgi:DNA processing protein